MKTLKNDRSLGSILINMGIITEPQLAEARAEQARQDDYILGSILLEMGMTSESIIEKAMEIQRMFENGNEAMGMMELYDTRMKMLGRSCDIVTEAMKGISA